MKRFSYILTFACCTLLTSCGKRHIIPEQDSSKWTEYSTRFLKHTLKYKYPGADGKVGFKFHRPHVDTHPLKKKDYIHFIFGLYDYYEYPHFDIKITLAKYHRDYNNKKPDFEKFQQLHLKGVLNSKHRTGDIEHEIKTIHGVPYLHIIFYDGKGRVRGETYRTPINDVAYLGISASYKEDPPTGTKGWLENRRKLFKEFAENVILTKPTEKKTPANAND